MRLVESYIAFPQLATKILEHVMFHFVYVDSGSDPSSKGRY